LGVFASEVEITRVNHKIPAIHALRTKFFETGGIEKKAVDQRLQAVNGIRPLTDLLLHSRLLLAEQWK